MNKSLTALFVLMNIVMFTACNPKPVEEKIIPEITIKEESVGYSADSINMNGFIAWNEADSSKRPVILIVHEWWGLNDYVKERARQLAEIGYIAMAVDMFGNGTVANTPDEADRKSVV